MARTFSRSIYGISLALASIATGFATGPLASASTVGPTKVEPHQHFAGLVNGKLENATVKVVCAGPSSTGRALPGQTLEVTSPLVIATNFGYTGSRGRSISASVSPASAAAPTVTFHKYNVPAAFPTNVALPCGGTGLVIFAPLPGSHSAKSATVTVSYANVATRGMP